VVAEIVTVGTVGDVLESACVGDGAQEAEQLDLAVVAAIRRVRPEPRVRELVRVDLVEVQAQLLGDPAGVRDLAVGIGVRGREHGEGVVAEYRVRRHGQQSRVDSARERDEHAAEIGEPRTEQVVLL
jgi:hypothetical protein